MGELAMPSDIRDGGDSADAPIGVIRIFPRAETAANEFWSIDEGVIVGRGNAAQIQLDDAKVAAVHARFVRHGSSVRVIVEAGCRPIRIDGVEPACMSGGVSVGSMLRFGDTLLLVVSEPARYRSHSESAAVEPGCARLLVGERGVGKRTAARRMHDASALRHRPFVSLDPRVIPPEVLDAALFGDEARDAALELGPLARSCGTLYIEQIDALKPELQAKLARALLRSSTSMNGAHEGAKVACVIASAQTETPCVVPELAAVFARGVVRIPPLRARRDEILTLVQALLRRSSPRSRLTCDAAELLVSAPWFENVSELRDAVARAVREAGAVGSEWIRAEHLPETLRLGAGGTLETPASTVVPIALEQGSIFCFDDYELDAVRFELRRNATVVRMQPRVFDLLLYLVRNANRVVTRSELLAGPWRGASVVRSALNQAIMLLRRTLEASDGTSPIKTIRQRGFQLDAVVTVRSPSPSNQCWSPDKAG